MSDGMSSRDELSMHPGAPEPQRRLQAWRRVSQVLGLLLPLFIAGLILVGYRGLIGSYYSLSWGPLQIVDPAMGLQALLLGRSFTTSLAVGLILPLLVALLLGRVFCGWICPYNTLMEAVQKLEQRFFPRRFASNRRRASQAGNPHPLWFWGILLALLALTMILGLPLLSYLSPPGLFSSQITQAILGLGVGLEFALVAVLMLVEISLGRRWWCRQLCPVGAVLGIFRMSRTLSVVHDADRCQCHVLREPCHLACPTDLVPKRDGLYPSCLNCALCVRACERTGYGALSLRTPWSRES